MGSSIKDLSSYRFEKAEEDIKTAEVLLENMMLTASINRSYYAIFHGMRAVTALSGFDSSKHSGIIAYFNQNFIKKGIFDKSMSETIKSAYRIREKSDYEDFYIVSKQEAIEQLEHAKEFLSIIEKYLDDEKD